jgi:hypothetical protein
MYLREALDGGERIGLALENTDMEEAVGNALFPPEFLVDALCLMRE